jgi:hypothetical protein
MILKLQRPMTPGMHPILVYDETRCVMMSLKATPDLLAMFDDDAKIYVKAKLEDDSLRIIGIVAPEDW